MAIYRNAVLPMPEGIKKKEKPKPKSIFTKKALKELRKGDAGAPPEVASRTKEMEEVLKKELRALEGDQKPAKKSPKVA